MPSVMSPIAGSNASMRAGRLKALPVCLMLLGLLAAALLPDSQSWLAADEAQAASAYTPRHSGMDAPGEPKRIETLPSKNAGRTAEGGMGYTDAYGNTIDDRQPEEKPAPKRPRPGAYGVGAGQSERYERPLPDPQNQTPAWSFK